LNGLRFAIGFLTVFPTSPKDSPVELASARTYFPLVGLILGGILMGVDFILKPAFHPLLSGAILVAALIFLTRALHLDGFMDSCDGLFGGFTRERRLEILRDSHVGAFAVVGVVSLLLIKWTSIVGLPSTVRLPVLVLFPCISRWAMLWDMQLFPYMRSQGLGTAFMRGRTKTQVVAGFATVLIASLLLAGFAGVLLLVLTTGIAWGFGRWIAGLLGGLTGDSYGAVNEVTEVAVLLLAILLAAVSPVLFASPLSLLV
jgi:adenosylcobinamide-GDP ribazoletransferase